MYRLLDDGEEVWPTDEYFSSSKLEWFMVLKLHDILDICDDNRIPVRRKFTPDEWISGVASVDGIKIPVDVK